MLLVGLDLDLTYPRVEDVPFFLEAMQGAGRSNTKAEDKE